MHTHHCCPDEVSSSGIWLGSWLRTWPPTPVAFTLAISSPSSIHTQKQWPLVSTRQHFHLQEEDHAYVCVHWGMTSGVHLHLDASKGKLADGALTSRSQQLTGVVVAIRYPFHCFCVWKYITGQWRVRHSTRVSSILYCETVKWITQPSQAERRWNLQESPTKHGRRQ